MAIHPHDDDCISKSGSWFLHNKRGDRLFALKITLVWVLDEFEFVIVMSHELTALVE